MYFEIKPWSKYIIITFLQASSYITTGRLSSRTLYQLRLSQGMFHVFRQHSRPLYQLFYFVFCLQRFTKFINLLKRSTQSNQFTLQSTFPITVRLVSTLPPPSPTPSSSVNSELLTCASRQKHVSYIRDTEIRDPCKNKLWFVPNGIWWTDQDQSFKFLQSGAHRFVHKTFIL